jgi:hypothetical protein
MDAIDGASRQAQLASSAYIFDDRVHLFVAANDGIGWANCNAKRATYAPSFINPSNASGRLCSIEWVQWNHRSPS